MKSTTSLSVALSAVLIFLAFNPYAFSALVSEWKFDGNGSNEVPIRPSAVPQGAAMFYAQGGVEGGFAHIPASTDHIRIPHSSFFDLPVTFTVMFWFRQYNDKDSYSDLLTKGSFDDGYNFRIHRLAGGGAVRASHMGASGVWPSYVETSAPLAHGCWHHVVYTKNATTHALYVDGVFTDSYQVFEDAWTNTSPIFVGQYAVETDVDELRIYDQAWTANKIARYYDRYVTAYCSTFEQNGGNLDETRDWQWGPYAWTGVNCTGSSSPPAEAHSGSRMWGTVLNGCYNNLGNNSGYASCTNDTPADDSILAFLVDLRGMPTATLTWWEWFDVYQPYDWAEVYVDGGMVYQYCSPGFQAPDSWRFQSVDLTPFVGRSVVITFHMMASTVIDRGGWWIDDVLIIGKSSLSSFLPSMLILLNGID